MDFQIVPGTDQDRRELAGLRAEEWRGALTPDQFALRNERLYGHPFGRECMHTYLLRDSRRLVLASMDVLDLSLLAGMEEKRGGLIASVITAPALRGRGYATRLLSWFFEKHPEIPMVLFSDVGAGFYERFGFGARPVTAVTLPGSDRGSIPSDAEAVSLFDFVDGLAGLRRQNVAASGRATGAVLPDPQLWDWQLERYRLFAEIARRPFPETLFWKLTHQQTSHLLAAVPDYLADRADLLWKYPGCRECEAVGAALASYWRVGKFRFWETDPTRAGRRECPMLRIPELPAPVFFSDPQLGDYW